MTSCGCSSTPALACTLGEADLGKRLEEWRALAAGATRRSIDGGVRLELDRSVLGEAARLAAAEHECCPFFSFALTLDGRGAGLEITAPPEARDLVDVLLGH